MVAIPPSLFEVLLLRLVTDGWTHLVLVIVTPVPRERKKFQHPLPLAVALLSVYRRKVQVISPFSLGAAGEGGNYFVPMIV